MGSIGSRHARNLSLLVDEIVAFDPNADRVADRRAACPLTWAESAEDAIRDAGCVIISTPHSLHLDQMWACVSMMKPFLVEKPITSSMAGLEELCQAVHEKKIVTQVGYNLRFHPVVERVREMVLGEAVGKTLFSSIEYGSYLPSWRPGKDYKANYASSQQDGGIILDDIHEIDIACHLFGDPEYVTCSSVNTGALGIASEEVANITLQGQSRSGLTAVRMDYLQRTPTRRIKVVGAEGTIEADLNSFSLKVDGEEMMERPHKFEANQMYVREVDHFLSRVRSGEADSSMDVSRGKKTLSVALLAKASAESGRRERV